MHFLGDALDRVSLVKYLLSHKSWELKHPLADPGISGIIYLVSLFLLQAFC